MAYEIFKFVISERIYYFHLSSKIYVRTGRIKAPSFGTFSPDCNSICHSTVVCFATKIKLIQNSEATSSNTTKLYLF